MLVTPDLLKFLLVLAKAALILVIYLACALGVYAQFRRAINAQRYAGVLLGISLVIGPVLMGWLLTMLLLAVPGQARSFYIVLPLLPFAVMILAGRKSLSGMWGDVISGWAGTGRVGVERTVFSLICVLIILVTLGAILVLTATTPLHGNDSIEYQIVGQTVAQSVDASLYPIVSADTANGFTAPWTHPMGYINLLTHAYLVQGFGETSGAARFVAPYFAMTLCLLMVCFGGYRNLMAGLLGAVFMLCTPLFLHLVIQFHIDPIRLATLTAALAAIWLLSQMQGRGLLALAGLAAGCAMFVHSIGILTLPLIIPAYLLMARRFGARTHALRMLTVTAIAIVMLVPRYIINFAQFGSLISDSLAVWEMDHLAIEQTRQVTRYMDTMADKLVNGALIGFTDTALFGWYYWLFLAALLLLILRTLKMMGSPLQALKDQAWRDWGDPALAALLVALGYAGMMGLTVMLGSDIAVKNVRYVLTMQPFIILFAARYLAQTFFPQSAAAASGNDPVMP